MLFTPLSQTVTPSLTPSPLERDVLYGRPQWVMKKIMKDSVNRDVAIKEM